MKKTVTIKGVAAKRAKLLVDTFTQNAEEIRRHAEMQMRQAHGILQSGLVTLAAGAGHEVRGEVTAEIAQDGTATLSYTTEDPA